MISTSFWEAYSEGRNAWDKGKLGWKIEVFGYKITAYHTFLFGLTFPLLISLPLIINGWDSRLFGVLLSAYSTGLVIQDFMWFVVNPKVSLSEFNPDFANYYPWISIGKFKLPMFYLVGVFISLLSWKFLWR